MSEALNHAPASASPSPARRARSGLALVGLMLLLSAFAPAESAADNYKSHCSACHGKHGNADSLIGRNLKLRPLHSADVQSQSDEQLFAVISKGKDKMPAFDRRLPKDQIHDLVTYIRTLSK
ncbi:MAG: cytochrome c [Terriglobales bacterium]